MIKNLTPHPMHVFPPDCPDRIEPGSVEPLAVVPPSGEVVRLGESVVNGPRALDGTGIPVVDITFGTGEGLPPFQLGVLLIVSRPVAMTNPRRGDLLVPHDVVRDLDGSTLGCRAFARPL